MHWSARCRARQELPLAVGVAQGESGEPVAERGTPYALFMSITAASINHTHASFQLTVVKGGGLTQCYEYEKSKKR